MTFENIHKATRIWNFVESSNFNMEFQALEDYFNRVAKEEEMITEKQHISIRSINVDAQSRVLKLETELFRLLEN